MRFKLSTAVASAIVAAAGLAAVSTTANAASNIVSGNGPASADLDFRVTIPSVLFLQVGTGTFKQDNGTVDTIAFDLTAAELVALEPVAGTGGGGEGAGPGEVSVRVFGNVGAVNLRANAEALQNAAGGTIPWSEITVTEGTGDIPHPAIPPEGGISAAVLLATQGNSQLVNRTDSWSFEYANTTEYDAGEYVATVTYTVSNP